MRCEEEIAAVWIAVDWPSRKYRFDRSEFGDEIVEYTLEIWSFCIKPGMRGGELKAVLHCGQTGRAWERTLVAVKLPV